MNWTYVARCSFIHQVLSTATVCQPLAEVTLLIFKLKFQFLFCPHIRPTIPITCYSPLRKFLKIILHTSFPIWTPIKDLYREATPCTRLQHRLRHFQDRKIAAIKWKRPEVMAPSSTRSEAARVFFVLKWRRWLVGITYLQEVEFLFGYRGREFFQAGPESSRALLGCLHFR
jgi:hypothetical protein